MTEMAEMKEKQLLSSGSMPTFMWTLTYVVFHASGCPSENYHFGYVGS